MPSFLTTRFGKAKPTVAAADATLMTLEAELAAAPSRIAKAEAALQRIADMTDNEHAAAEAELAAAHREKARIQARVADLRQVRDAAKKAEAEDALRAERAVVQTRMDGMPGLLDRYDMAAKATADAVEVINKVDGEVAAFNRKIEAARRAGLDTPEPIKTSTELYRSEPDRVEPDQTVTETIWEYPDGYGRWTRVDILSARDGDELQPNVAGARKRDAERVIPGKRRPGRRIDSPAANLSLPPSRVGGKTHWPR